MSTLNTIHKLSAFHAGQRKMRLAENLYQGAPKAKRKYEYVLEHTPTLKAAHGQSVLYAD